MPSTENALTPDRGCDTPAGDPGVPAAAVKKTRVLLLDDDPSFNEVIRDFLIESNYTVVAVANGAEGIREVVSGDFAVVLCDMVMPTLSGEKFYRAVARILPHLCDRFVFMTGYRQDARTSEFIEITSGQVLQKPFHLTDLLNAVTLAEVRGAFKTVCAPVKRDLSRRQRAAEITAKRPESAVRPPIRYESEPALPPGERRKRGLVIFILCTVVGLAVFIGCAGHFDRGYRTARDHAAAVEAEHLALEAEWKLVAPQFEEAEKVRNKLAALPKRVKRLAEERATGRWVGALRAVATTAGPEIDWRSAAARGVQGPPGACEMRLSGGAVGGGPRVILNEFYKALDRELEMQFPGMTKIVLEKVEDEPDPPAPSAQHRSSFTISVKIDSKERPAGEREGAK